MGMVERLISKYRGTADLFCEDVYIEESERDDAEHVMIGINCSVKVAGMKFDFDKVRTNCNKVASNCDIPEYDPEKMIFKFSLNQEKD